MHSSRDALRSGMAAHQHRLGKILVTIPEAPAWAMWPAIIGHHERAAARPMRRPLARQMPGSVGLIVCLAGSGQATGTGWSRPVVPGAALLFRNGQDDFQIEAQQGRPLWRSLDIYLHGDLAHAAAAGLIAAHGHLHRTDPGAAVWQEALAAIPGGFCHARVWSLEQGMSFASRALSRLAVRPHDLAPQDSLVSAALGLMREVGTLRSVADIALRLDVSREHLSRRLSAAGVDAAATFRRIRIERACTLLANRSLSIAEIARSCGWRSQASFARAIVLATGRTPRALRSAGTAP
jgi:AraC-like DNA-binding protein